jgi:molybdate transport system substrate-binding protein
MVRRIIAVLLLAAPLLVGGADGAMSAELKILGSRVTKVISAELAPQIEKATGFKPVVDADVAQASKRKVENGELFDVAVLVDFQIDDLIKQGRLVAGSRMDLMKSGIGVAVKRGAPKPDISTVEAFKQTLLKAKSITYLKEGASTIHLRKVFDQLGIADAILGKTVQTMTESVSELVADGQAEIGLIVTPNILSVPGAELVGELPAELNKYVMFTAAISAQSPNKEAARKLLEFLKTPEATAVIKAKGNEPS